MSGYWGWGTERSLGRTLLRFIKRKKFDDELVESSLAKSSTRAKGASGVEPGRCSGSEPSSSEKKKVRIGRRGEWRGVGASARFCVSPQPLPAGKSPAEEAYERIKLPRPTSDASLLGAHPSLLRFSCCTHHHPVSASCITFCVGGIECASILGADSLFRALLAVKITPRWHCSGPRRCTSKSVFLVSSPPTLHAGVGGRHQQKKDPIWSRTV